MSIALLRRAIKQQDTAAAVLRGIDPELAKGLRELAVEPLAMLDRGDIEGAANHIKWLRLENDELELFWSLFDSTQRRLMKEKW